MPGNRAIVTWSARREEQKAEVAKNIVKDELIMYAIADKEGIELTDEAYNNFIKASYKKFKMSEKKFKEINNGKTLEKDA